jgi:hypothetical protein
MAFDIKQFRSEINTNGILLPTKFIVQFQNLPKKLKESHPSYEKMSLRCEQILWPGVSFSTMDSPARAGYGATELIPFAPMFEEISMTFIVDEHAKVHKFFFDWMNSIINIDSKGQTNFKGGDNRRPAYEVGYKNDYVCDINISIFRESGTDEASSPMNITLYRAFPRILTGYQLDWSYSDQLLKLPVIFTYTDYFVQYPEHTEKPHDAPSHDKKTNSH